jgi:hypothetical protein
MTKRGDGQDLGGRALAFDVYHRRETAIQPYNVGLVLK